MNDEYNTFTEEQQTNEPLIHSIRPRTRGWSVASLVVGILSIVCCCLPYGGLVFGILAILFAFLSRRELDYFDGLALAGLILGIVGTVFGVYLLVSFLTADPEEVKAQWEEIRREAERQQSQNLGRIDRT